MTNSNNPLAAFRFNPVLGWWAAEWPVLCWGETLPVQIDAPASGPAPRQVETLNAILKHKEDLRGPVGAALLSHYLQEWGNVTPSLGTGPELQSPEEVWTAMSAVALFIPAFRSATGGVVFEFHLDTIWDEDHGLCVLVRDWQIVRVTGQMDCRGAEL
jgi:hypothetical protein